MNRRTISGFALSGGLLAAAMIPTAHAGNVAWGVSVGGPGFSVSAGQPGYWGGSAWRYARPYYGPAYGAVVVPPVTFVSPPVAFPYVAPAPVVLAPRPVVRVWRPTPVRYWRY